MAFVHIILAMFCMGPFKWPKATKLFMIVLSTHNFTSHGAHRAQIRWPKATRPLQKLEGGAHSTPNFNLTQQLEVWPP